eukprot:17199-Eustigmatos_ZCMA.PRE.1
MHDNLIPATTHAHTGTCLSEKPSSFLLEQSHLVEDHHIRVLNLRHTRAQIQARVCAHQMIVQNSYVSASPVQQCP